MTVNQKIESALSELVNGNIWPLVCPLETEPAQWITYQPELEAPEEFGDDTDLEWVHYMQIHWFAKSDGGGKGAADYIAARSEIRNRLKTAGFCIESFTQTYEHDTRTTHMVCCCNIIEEMETE
ncbi:MAG: DUF3168 domain-containing protein [Lachnospiraceae bacterium]|nr:DUF3168 domain-containing protein [Lachnospiraceae bacterium]